MRTSQAERKYIAREEKMKSKPNQAAVTTYSRELKGLSCYRLCSYMHPSLKQSPLGIYADRNGDFRSEYQIGTTLIWVVCRHHIGCQPCVDKADALLPDIWSAMPDAVAMAEDDSRTMIPEFWRQHDMSQREGARMAVWGITITPGTGEACFDISTNFDFDFDSPTFSKDDVWNETPIVLPDLPDSHHIYVVRNCSGQLTVVSGHC